MELNAGQLQIPFVFESPPTLPSTFEIEKKGIVSHVIEVTWCEKRSSSGFFSQTPKPQSSRTPLKFTSCYTGPW